MKKLWTSILALLGIIPNTQASNYEIIREAFQQPMYEGEAISAEEEEALFVELEEIVDIYDQAPNDEQNQMFVRATQISNKIYNSNPSANDDLNDLLERLKDVLLCLICGEEPPDNGDEK